jgi:hypothetical protein
MSRDTPYIYIATGRAKDITRSMPDGARVALHFPAIGRTLEVQVEANGCWSLSEMGAPGYFRDPRVIDSGQLDGRDNIQSTAP